MGRIGDSGVLGSLGHAPPVGQNQFGRELRPRPRARMVEKLMALLEEENWAVRLGAAEGLATLAIRASFVVPKLEQTLEQEHLDYKKANAARKMLERLEEQGAMRD